MKITMINKIKRNGQNCAKSARVLTNLEELGFINQIDQIIAADERDQSSEGFALARKYNIATAPFFIIDKDDGLSIVYSVYHRFLDDIFNYRISEKEEILEIMAQNPDLDFI